jgi:replicative DNA helicase
MAVSVPPGAGAGVPPHSEEAEASVIGAILLTDQAFDLVQVDVGLRAADFYRLRHQLIFEAMSQLTDKPMPEAIDALTVSEQLKGMGKLEEVGGEAYVHSLPTTVPSVGNVLDYARIVKGHSMRRRLLDATREIQGRIFTDGGDPRELVDQAEQLLFRVGHEEGTGELKPIEEILDVELDKLEQLSREGADVTGTPSGFIDIDSITGGFQPGNLIVLAARPSMGKSALVTNIAENAAVDGQRPVAIFSLEMSETELAQRFVASQARINGDDLRKGRVKDDRWSKVLRAAQKISSAPLYVDDSSDIGIAEMRAKARRLHARQPLGLLIVDYLQLMRPDGRTDNRVEQIGQISRGLKILARELEVPVIAVSQLSRAVEQRPDKKPLLSDLRESGCVTGDTRVYLPSSGEYRRIEDLVGKSGFEVLAVDPSSWKLEPRRVTNVFPTGRKRVHKLTTQLGREIEATGNHRFLTIDGWRRLDELGPGDRVALPRSLPEKAVATMSDDELGLLGHLIGDGCTLPDHAIQYTTREPELANEVVGLASRVFGERITPRVKHERSWYQVYLRSARQLTHGVRNPVATWLDSLGVFGLRSHEKRVPQTVMGQPKASIATFLRHLWATDGCVWLGKASRAQPAVYYATSSALLARDVQSLLLRIGINARRHCVKPATATTKAQYHVRVSGAADLRQFVDKVGAVGGRRKDRAHAIDRYLGERSPNTNRDTIPKTAWTRIVKPAMSATGVTSRGLQTSLGLSYCGSSLYRTSLSRDRAHRTAAAICSHALERLADSDIYWDRVETIRPVGSAEVFDLTVEDLHNFVAEDILVHNSIEQDADVVMFVYRDEYYNKEESERPGEADILIAKHRNGPVTDVVLTFQGRYPKFLNYRQPAGP